jgi:hypothetical protein
MAEFLVGLSAAAGAPPFAARRVNGIEAPVLTERPDPICVDDRPGRAAPLHLTARTLELGRKDGDTAAKGQRRDIRGSDTQIPSRRHGMGVSATRT